MASAYIVQHRKAVIALAVAVPCFAAFALPFLFDASRQSIDVTGTLQAKEVPVASKLGGRIAKVYAAEGEEVKQGDLLVEFDAPELAAKRQQAQAEVLRNQALLDQRRHGPRRAEIDKARAAAQQAYQNWQMLKNGYRAEDVEKATGGRAEGEANLSLLSKGYRQEEINQAKYQMEQSRVQLEFQRRDCQNYKELAERGAVSKHEANEQKTKFETAEQAYNAARENFLRLSAGPRPEEINAARQRLEIAKANEKMMRRGPRAEEIESAHQQYLAEKGSLTLLEQGTREEEIAESEANLKQAQAALAELEAQWQERLVKSPVAAEVSVMDLHAGEVLAPQKSVATLTRLDEVWTRAYVPERELGRCRVGEMVDVKADAFPKRVFRGKIVQIPSVAEFTPRNVQTAEERSAQVFGLKITIENKEHLLRGGMNATITLPPFEKPFESVARREDATGHSP